MCQHVVFLGSAVNRIARLVVVHVVLALGLASAMSLGEQNEINAFFVAMPFMATAFSQCGLLAFWLAHGRSSMQKRAWTSLFGAVYLWWLNVFAFEAWGRREPMIILPILVFGCIASLAAILLLVSRWKSGFRLVSSAELSVGPQPEQFSLRHVFLLMLGISAVLAGGELIKPYVNAGLITRVLACIVVPICFIEAVLAGFWAALGNGRITLRTAFAVGLAALTGLIPAYYFRVDSRAYFLSVGIASLGQLITIASLLVVRSASYRLVRREALGVETEPATDVLAHPLD